MLVGDNDMLKSGAGTFRVAVGALRVAFPNVPETGTLKVPLPLGVTVRLVEFGHWSG
jgi:hypothetical protein